MFGINYFKPEHNRKRVSVTSAPTSEPISIDDVKLAAKIDGSAEDALVLRIAKASREYVEKCLNRALITQTLKLSLDAFPTNVNGSMNFDERNLGPAPATITQTPAIDLPMGPIQSISSVKYWDSTNTQQTFDSANYYLDAAGSRICLVNGASWPADLRPRAGVEISYVAGYGNASAVPNAIQEAILQLAVMTYEERGCGCETPVDMPRQIEAMLTPYRQLRRFGLGE